MRSAMGSSGTMELVAMELKQSGYFLARTLSYEASPLLCRPATSMLWILHTTCLKDINRQTLGSVRQIRALCHM